jgi:hypothetical protein
VSSSACTNWAITGTRFPPAEASTIIVRRGSTNSVRYRRTICCSFCPSWSVSLRPRTGSATAPPAVGSDVTAHPTATTTNPANLCGHSTRYVHGDLLADQKEAELRELRLLVRQVVLRWLILTPYGTQDLAPRLDAAADCTSCSRAINEPLRAFLQASPPQEDVRA